MSSHLQIKLTVTFPMRDGETVSEAEDRLIERIDSEDDVVLMSWNEKDVEVIEDDDNPDSRRAVDP